MSVRRHSNNPSAQHKRKKENTTHVGWYGGAYDGCICVVDIYCVCSCRTSAGRSRCPLRFRLRRFGFPPPYLPRPVVLLSPPRRFLSFRPVPSRRHQFPRALPAPVALVPRLRVCSHFHSPRPLPGSSPLPPLARQPRERTAEHRSGRFRGLARRRHAELDAPVDRLAPRALGCAH